MPCDKIAAALKLAAVAVRAMATGLANGLDVQIETLEIDDG
ncbi:hypothetical protein [Candidatus Poriferisocius sp.]